MFFSWKFTTLGLSNYQTPYNYVKTTFFVPLDLLISSVCKSSGKISPKKPHNLEMFAYVLWWENAETKHIYVHIHAK